MTVKHQPATPLPWYPAYGLTTGAVHSKPLNEQTNDTRLSAKNLKRADAAYMFHAANAYPKLIEALRAALLAWEKPNASHTPTYWKNYERLAGLLRELGEAP